MLESEKASGRARLVEPPGERQQLQPKEMAFRVSVNWGLRASAATEEDCGSVLRMGLITIAWQLQF